MTVFSSTTQLYLQTQNQPRVGRRETPKTRLPENESIDFIEIATGLKCYCDENILFLIYDWTFSICFICYLFLLSYDRVFFEAGRVC